MSIAAYKQNIRESESPRSIERRVMSRVTAELDGYLQDYEAGSRFDRMGLLAGGLRRALIDNQTLWRELRYDLASEGNQLPAGLRAQLISIGLWVDRQTTAVLSGEAGLGDLVGVNRQIVAGLNGVAPQPQEL
ncbi:MULTISPECIES: flagellar biosynthesis regulator FlaF [unclassified Roseivivax]|uniref:flagellar biosynthesis regulator FlaF n=1 Tax=Roseivivax sp. GX 12232 TaxID=2900547 RepID=UPI001E56B4CB|nr:flagellar biosynthesis regulator FlaF [Roseivivax sp. GX 12232]MCE0503882.1 flagellar biosynthesis regulator FlaF [Roseivivax sp. GX 12232]